ncbi:hypothetical protein HA402_004868 [Bradysia odoriphaga]|nr:hypothetical protein HA402_004868 [Bradysia odoriphaga]
MSLEGEFPTRWKESYVVPIFKDGSRSDVECYRVVAILPTFAKLFESIVCGFLVERLGKIVSLSQHGFVPGRSTSTNLIEFVNEAIRTVESGDQVDVVYTDVRKAFDRVSHGHLISKLREYGIHSSLLQWLSSYLQGRTQYVKIEGWKSRSFASVRDCNALQDDLVAVHRWCGENGLELSIGKCKVMSFYRKRNPILYAYVIGDERLARVKEMKDLGVTFTENLIAIPVNYFRFSEHDKMEKFPVVVPLNH